jgi:hypothetical protein
MRPVRAGLDSEEALRAVTVDVIRRSEFARYGSSAHHSSTAPVSGLGVTTARRRDDSSPQKQDPLQETRPRQSSFKPRELHLQPFHLLNEGLSCLTLVARAGHAVHWRAKVGNEVGELVGKCVPLE